MKMIVTNGQITSLENVKEVSVVSNDTIRVSYMDGYMIPSSQVFAHHSTMIYHVKDTGAVLKQIAEILSEKA
jgi:hypothetical protein